ncbi:hypothetical protein LTR48_003556 [Friedmanniomyces endolithicus]|uniref:Uncharacterized protein n=1 Tax=Rachicladosporium monterosium TaxID=1507873 RepID=A0ABR0L9X9_9PEZI|nr:hypothetical protein LTR48_003556 [Friedmanniomyces endolithicus]KAK5144881.1 hypothetical protein LTR32_003264 [Rachicladosporium monterosium]
MNLAVRTHLDGYIIPSTSNKRPAVPNHLTEVKGLSGGSDVLRRQATYAGAIGARAMHEVQNYGNDQPVYDGNAYTLVPTYNSGEGSLKIYATHPTQSATGRREYHMTQLDSYAMMGNANSFRQGATAFRNSRDLSKEYRDRFIAAQTLLRRRDRHPLPHPPAALQAEALPPQGPRAHFEEPAKRQRKRSAAPPHATGSVQGPGRQSRQQASPCGSSSAHLPPSVGAAGGCLWQRYFFQRLRGGNYEFYYEFNCTIHEVPQIMRAQRVPGQLCPQVYDPKPKRWIQSSLEGQLLQIFARGGWIKLGKQA